MQLGKKRKVLIGSHRSKHPIGCLYWSLELLVIETVGTRRDTEFKATAVATGMTVLSNRFMVLTHA